MNTKITKGFTIIEVVLVLAIASLIILMVLVALPALQSGQRDQARKNDVGAIVTAVSNYSGNNRGAAPNTTQLTGVASGQADATTGKFAGYLQSVGNNTTTVTVSTATGATAVSVTEGVAKVVLKSQCDASGATGTTAVYNVKPGTARQFSVVTFIEGGSGSAFCQNS